jgi:phosphopantetheinyl transferase
LNIFYEIWCLKEALLKSYGTGLTDYLSKEDFNLNGKPRDAKNVTINIA